MTTPTNGEEIIHQGWLDKKGRVMKNWKRRWFILRTNILEYYDAQHNGNKKGDIEMTCDTRVLMRDGSTHLFKFGIQTGERILELSTVSDVDRLQWMDAIHNTVKSLHNNSSKTAGDGRIKDRVSNLLAKKTNMEEDTPMNRVLRGHATMNEAPATSKPPRRANRRPLNKKTTTSTTTQPITSDKGNECLSDDESEDQETNISTDHPVDEISNNNSNSTNTNLPPPPAPQPLPEGWAQVTTEDGRIYYYHTITRVSRWDFPTAGDEIVPPSTQPSETTKGHAVETTGGVETLDEEQIKALVSLSVRQWLQPSNMNRTRSIPELLTAIPTILDSTLVPEGAICREPLTLSSPPNDVKKAYLRAIRLVHPDKLVAIELTLEQRLLSQEVFIHISEKYDLYRKAHGL